MPYEEAEKSPQKPFYEAWSRDLNQGVVGGGEGIRTLDTV